MSVAGYWCGEGYGHVRWRWAWDILGGQRLRSNCRTIEALRKRGEENISVAGYWCGEGYGHVRWRWAWDILGGQKNEEQL